MSYQTGNKSYEKNNYLYNSKELQKDFDLDWYDYGARFYDAVLGRFHMVDPMTEDYVFQSLYAYAVNNPTRYIDWMGMGPSEILEDLTKEEAKKMLSMVYENSFATDPNSVPKKQFEYIRAKPGDPPIKPSPSNAGPKSDGKTMKPSSSYDYTQEVIPGKMSDDWAYISNGESGTMVSRFADIITRDWNASSSEQKSEFGLNVAGALLPFVRISGVKNLVKIGEISDDVIVFSSKFGDEVVEGISNFKVVGNKLHLNRLHLQGSSASKIGRANLWNMAKDLGKQFKVKEVIIQGGKRTTGKYKGTVPSPITIKVN